MVLMIDLLILFLFIGATLFLFREDQMKRGFRPEPMTRHKV